MVCLAARPYQTVKDATVAFNLDLHIPMRIYMGVLVLDIVLQYMVPACLFKLFLTWSVKVRYMSADVYLGFKG